MQKLHTTGRAVVRIAFILAALCLFYAVANAYTVVMRGGKRVEIPSHFVVTASTLTYEVSPGVQITLETAAIDIAATEKANNESPGSFMRRIQTAATGSSAEREISNTQAPATRRTITNRDLESAMLRRRNSELTYETRRKQLGLPSVGSRGNRQRLRLRLLRESWPSRGLRKTNLKPTGARGRLR
jgi:hypothetical protein